MFEKLKTMINDIHADYVDLRYEIKHNEKVIFVNGELRSAYSNSADGYVLRVFKDGGLGTIVFTNPEDIAEASFKALENIMILNEFQEKQIRLAKAEVIKDSFKPVLNEDPRNISFQEKKEIAKHYNDLLSKQSKVVESSVAYEDIIREKYFVNSEGSEIFEELVTTRLQGSIVCQEGDLTQNVSFGYGGSDGFHKIRNREKEMLQRAQLACDLLDAEPVKAGVYKAILNPSMTGLFTHEAFGHLSEADGLEYAPVMREKMKIGEKLGSDLVNITDDATMPGQLGFYKYDDEGVPVRKVRLMTKGVLTGRLHNRFTAAEFDEPLSGHSIAEDFKYTPLIRMGNIFMEPGESSFEELLAQMGDGLYLCGEMGGQTQGENFTFGANWGYEVKEGKITHLIRDINMMGNLFETLNNIVAVANDFELEETGGCGKGQMNIRSNIGGPHILISKIIIGGV